MKLLTDGRSLKPRLSHNNTRFQPVLIGGINALSGNKPPWLHAGKGKYLQLDSRRSSQRVGLDKACSPPDLMSVSHTISPLRALHFIKAHYPLETFLSAIEFLFHQFWSPPHVNLTVDENLRKALLAATGKDGSGRTLFSEDHVQKILDGRVLMKDVLKEQTARAVELGAFGAPWLWVTNAKGETQPFFGSDR